MYHKYFRVDSIVQLVNGKSYMSSCYRGMKLTVTALISDSWPVNVCLHMPSRMSQSLAEASQAPETKVRLSGERERLITSPVWPVKPVVCCPVSMSQRPL